MIAKQLAIFLIFSIASRRLALGVIDEGEIVVQHANGTRAIFRAVENTDLDRGRALLQAQDASKPGDRIRIGPGVFELPGSLVTKRNQTVAGSGIGLTTLRWAPLLSQPSSTDGAQLVGNNYFTPTNGVTVRGMTIDCNAQNHSQGVGAEGVVLNGSNCLIEDIKVINPGRTDGRECFPVAFYSGENTVRKANSHIRRVEVTQPAMILWKNGLSCILIGGTYYKSSIEDCYVHDIDVGDSSGAVAGKPRYVHAFGLSGSKDGAPPCRQGWVAHNRAINLVGIAGAQGAAVYTDTGSVDGYDIRDNQLINVTRGVHLHEATSYDNVKIRRNEIRFLSDISTTGGIMLSGRRLTSCLIADNDISQQTPVPATGSFAIAIGLGKHVTLRNNILRMRNKTVEIYVAPGTEILGANNRRADGSAISIAADVPGMSSEGQHK